WLNGIRWIFASNERKARDAAQILADALGFDGHSVVPDLRENDRSATGYLPTQEFEATADAFFAHPHESIRGWEPAVVAQARIVRAVEEILMRAPSECDMAIVGHGGTGTLLYCHLVGPVMRDWRAASSRFRSCTCSCCFPACWQIRSCHDDRSPIS